MDRGLLPEFLDLGEKKEPCLADEGPVRAPSPIKNTKFGARGLPAPGRRKSQLLGQSTIYVGLRIECHSRLEVVADADGQNVGAVVSFNSSGFLRGA